MADLQLTRTNWVELLDSVRDILIQDEARLENNISFYKKLCDNPKADRPQIERAYQKILWDKHRLLYFAEVANRLCKFDLLIIAENLQAAIESEGSKKEGKIENLSFTVRKDKTEISTYFYPLPNA